MTVTQDVRERGNAAQRDAGEDDAWSAGTPFGGLADRAMRVLWLWPTLLTAILGCYQLGRPELWRDELYGWSFAADPVPQLIASVRKTNAAQLAYDLMLHYWMAAFGASADAMRVLSVLAMAGAAAFVTLAGRRLAGDGAGLLAGLIFALLPSVSRFAQEVRFYSLDMMLAALSLLVLLRALDQPTVRRWTAYGLSLAVLGYIDVVALAVVVGHAAGAVLRWWRERDACLLAGFAVSAVAGLGACLPIIVVGWGEAGRQVYWISRPGLDLTTFALFGRSLFFSTSVAAVVILLAVLAWAVDRQAAAFATALAILPVAAAWLLSQGPHSYFFPRYLLPTITAWAILAGIALSRMDIKLAAATVLVVALLGAGDQQVIREPGAHTWATYPVGPGKYYLDYAGVAAIIARQARPGDAIAYQAGVNSYLMIGPGLQYYLGRDMPRGMPVPREVFVAKTSPQSTQVHPAVCHQPAACLGNPARIWVVGSGDLKYPSEAVTHPEAAILSQHYRLSYRKHVPSLTVFLLVST